MSSTWSWHSTADRPRHPSTRTNTSSAGCQGGVRGEVGRGRGALEPSGRCHRGRTRGGATALRVALPRSKRWSRVQQKRSSFPTSIPNCFHSSGIDGTRKPCVNISQTACPIRPATEATKASRAAPSNRIDRSDPLVRFRGLFPHIMLSMMVALMSCAI